MKPPYTEIRILKKDSFEYFQRGDKIAVLPSAGSRFAGMRFTVQSTAQLPSGRFAVNVIVPGHFGDKTFYYKDVEKIAAAPGPDSILFTLEKMLGDLQ